MSETLNRSYYAIIPASVRYDDRLTPNEKLFYGEITALCNEKGYCWAGNKYFSDLYGVHKNSISRWISHLATYNYITVKLVYKEDSKEVKSRQIYIVDENNSNKDLGVGVYKVENDSTL